MLLIVMARFVIGRRRFLSALAAGLTATSAGCGSDGDTDGNGILINVRGADVTVDLVVERVSDGEVLLSETVTPRRLGTEEGGPSERYDDVFGTETVRISFDVHDGPDRSREFTLDETDSAVTIYYRPGSIEFEVEEIP
jgi:hypothetical protein